MKLFNGNCLEIMGSLEDNSIDMVFCDPPYGTTQNKWDSVIPFEEMWSQLNRICKPDAPQVFTTQMPFTAALVASNFKNYRCEWIWHKNKATGHLNAKRYPMKAHENVVVFSQVAPVYNPQITHGHKPVNNVYHKEDNNNGSNYGKYTGKTSGLSNASGKTTRYPRTVQDISVTDNIKKEKWHPTQKPVELAEYFIKTYSNEGDAILDFTMGSGSTGIACVNTNREFIGIELNPEYFAKAKGWLDGNSYKQQGWK